MAKKKYNWKNFPEARSWVTSEYGDLTRGKTMTKKKQKKIMESLWNKAKLKDSRGEF